MESSNNIFDNIDLISIAKALWKRVWLIILSAVVGGALMFSYAKFMLTPRYSSSIMIYVNNYSLSLGGSKVTFSSSEISAAQKLVDTYITILTTYETMAGVIERSGIHYTPNQLMGMVTANQVNETEIFRVTVQSSDPNEAAIVANAFADVLPDQISDVIEGSSVKVVSRGRVSYARVYPSYTSHTLIGILLGGILSTAIIIAIKLFDDIIHDEDYLLQNYKYPLLASIPSLDHLDSQSKYTYYYYSYDTINRKTEEKK